LYNKDEDRSQSMNRRERNMSDNKLRELLEQLHDELARTESVDEKGREMLQHISGDIQNSSIPPRKTLKHCSSGCRKRSTISKWSIPPSPLRFPRC
jgi:hypothetical protein